MKITIELDDTDRTTTAVKVFHNGEKLGLIQSLVLECRANEMAPRLTLLIPKDNPEFNETTRETLRKLNELAQIPWIRIDHLLEGVNAKFPDFRD